LWLHNIASLAVDQAPPATEHDNGNAGPESRHEVVLERDNFCPGDVDETPLAPSRNCGDTIAEPIDFTVCWRNDLSISTKKSPFAAARQLVSEELV